MLITLCRYLIFITLKILASTVYLFKPIGNFNVLQLNVREENCTIVEPKSIRTLPVPSYNSGMHLSIFCDLFFMEYMWKYSFCSNISFDWHMVGRFYQHNSFIFFLNMDLFRFIFYCRISSLQRYIVYRHINNTLLLYS